MGGSQMTNPEYNKICLELDKELSTLLGWTNIAESDFPGDYVRFKGDNPSLNKVYEFIPRCTLNDGAAFRLAVEYDVTVNYSLHPTHVTVAIHQEFPKQIIKSIGRITDFPDKLSALRYCIVQATINKLKGGA
jgi:hypothetical protein